MKRYFQIALLACIVPLMSHAYTMTFEPVSGQIDGLGGRDYQIDVYCSDGITVVDGTSGAIKVLDENGDSINYSFLTSQFIGYCRIRLKNTHTDDGIYYLVIPAGFFLLGTDNSEELQVPNEETTVKYWIGDVIQTLDLVTTPAADDEVTEPLTSITVSTESENGLTLADGVDLSKITVVNDDTNDSYYCTEYTLTDDGAYELTLNEFINTTGSYTLTIPGEYFTGTGEDGETEIENDNTYVSFTLTATPQGTITSITPADESVTMSSISEIVLTATGYIELAAEDVSGLTVTSGENETIACEEITIGDADDDGTFTITCSFASDFTDADTYTVNIPDGFFNTLPGGLTVSEEFTSTFTIAAIEADPADGATVGGALGNVITLTSNVQFVRGTTDDGEAMIMPTDMSDLYADCMKCEIAEDGYSCTLTFDEEVTDSPCMLYIPKGYFTFMDKDFTATYSIADITLAFDPADGTVTNLSEITVTYAGGIALNEDSDVSDITLTSSDGETVISATSCTAGEDNTQVVITFEETIAPGEYTLNIPADIFTLTLDSETNSYAGNEEISVVYNLADLTLTFDPESGTVESLSEIIVAYEGGIARNRSGNVSDITLTSEDGLTVITATSCEPDEESTNDGDYTQFVITFTEPEESGEYTLYIPADFFSLTLDSDNFIYANNEEVSVVYTLELPVPEGINGVNADIFDDAEIYTTTGQRVNTPVRGQVNIVRKSDGSVKNVFVK